MRDNPTAVPARALRALRALRRSSPCHGEAFQLVCPPRHRFVSPDAALRRLREDEKEAVLERAEFPRGDHAPPEDVLRVLR